jgi:hypothetical protein
MSQPASSEPAFFASNFKLQVPPDGLKRYLGELVFIGFVLLLLLGFIGVLWAGVGIPRLLVWWESTMISTQNTAYPYSSFNNPRPLQDLIGSSWAYSPLVGLALAMLAPFYVALTSIYNFIGWALGLLLNGRADFFTYMRDLLYIDSLYFMLWMVIILPLVVGLGFWGIAQGVVWASTGAILVGLGLSGVFFGLKVLWVAALQQFSLLKAFVVCFVLIFLGRGG